MSIKHIRHTHGDMDQKSWCGKDLTQFDWTFTSVDHAAYSIMQDTTVQPCAKCCKAVSETLLRKEPK